MTSTYPPVSTEGIPRQRQILARELAARGHDVHVMTCGEIDAVRQDQGVQVHTIAQGSGSVYTADPATAQALSVSEALYRLFLRVAAEKPFDIVDAPFWAAPGFVTLHRYSGPVVLWLHTGTLQLLETNNAGHTAGIARLEQICLSHAAALLSDSDAALEQVYRSYAVHPPVPTTVVHLGIPPITTVPRQPAADTDRLFALVVGRLERRKGTPLLFEALPELLQRHPNLHVRFAGRDNSREDGWYDLHGHEYAASFAQIHPELSRQVSFEGYVSEEHLAQLYHQSDVLLAPSLYESFGTFYLEAMQAGLPVITFENGGACEIFAQQQDDGAILVPSGDIAAFVQAADHILTDPALRRRIGLNGQRRYHAAFTSDKMAAATIQFYHKVLEAHKPRQSAQQPIYQVMEALDVGDAVSGITQVSASMLGQLGQPDIILSRYSHNALRHKTRPLHTAVETPDCSLIFHYWNYNSSTWLLNAVRGRKAIYYHNVTPPSFFASDSTTYRNMMRGYRQMFEIADHFDLIIGVSRYNIHEFLRFTTRTVPTIPIYPVVERNALHKTPYDNRLYDQLSKKHHTNIVFIGRIVRNKRQDQLIRLFDYYYRVVNNHATLWLIGNEGSDPEYRAELEQLRRSLRSSHQIVFTGKVDDDALFAYLRAAHLFVCASEHEGFCVPIVQAMAFDIPVLAYATSAIPETMGQSGLLLQEWDIPRIAELMHLARTDSRFRRNIQLGQRKNMQRFTSNEAYNRLHAVVRYLQDQTPDTLFEYPQREYPTSVPFLGDTIGLNQ